MSEQRTVSLIGLPRTGKSTYVGALWLLVQDPKVKDIREEDFTGDRSYINWLSQQVADGIVIDRTEVDSDQGLSMKLDFAGKGTVQLDMPDLAGEAARELVEQRVWHRPLGDAISRSDALMLFVHPDKTRAPSPANLATSVATASERNAEEGEPRKGPEFTAAQACTAAKLVEVLENVLDLRSDIWPVPVALVISAWDRRSNPELTPRRWLDDRLPGVSGFMDTNPDVIRPAVFGVSAQGGRLPEERDTLMKMDVAERVFAADGDGNSIPLFAPLQWAVWP
jgi:hypothetical protein